MDSIIICDDVICSFASGAGPTMTLLSGEPLESSDGDFGGDVMTSLDADKLNVSYRRACWKGYNEQIPSIIGSVRMRGSG